jgi:hypothetical protein
MDGRHETKHELSIPDCHQSLISITYLQTVSFITKTDVSYSPNAGQQQIARIQSQPICR